MLRQARECDGLEAALALAATMVIAASAILRPRARPGAGRAAARQRRNGATAWRVGGQYVQHRLCRAQGLRRSRFGMKKQPFGSSEGRMGNTVPLPD